MARKANPALIGAFVLGALALALAGLVVFGGGKFFRETQPWVLYFDESIKGLSIGAPVLFRGVKVGSVTDIKVVVDREKTAVRTPVFIELEAHRMTDASGRAMKFEKGAPGVKVLIEQGVRAQLQLQSFVTGQLAIAFDFHPGTPVRLTGLMKDYPELPTIPSATEKLTRTLENLPIEELVTSTKEAVQGINRFVNAPEVKQVLSSAARTMKDIEQMADHLDRHYLTPLRDDLRKVTAAADETLKDIRGLVRTVDAQTVPAAIEALRDAGKLVRDVNAQTVPAATEALRDASKLLRDVDSQTVPAVNAGLADVRRLVGDLEKAAEEARAALQEAQTMLSSAGGALEGGSPLGYEFATALGELRGAARAVRALAEYLERHPEALLTGKNTGGGQ